MPDGFGLTQAEAERLLAEQGENALAEQHVSTLQRLAHFFTGPIPWMIEVAALLSALLGHWADLAIILTLLLINSGVGFWREFKADNAIELLKARLAPQARVRRDGAWRDIAARELVPGDLVHVKLGNIVPADLRLVGDGFLSLDEAALTGESLPVDKKAGDAAYSGSIAKQGEMDGIVVATGMRTYFGKTARLVRQAGATSHFQQAVLGIGNYLILVTVALVLLIGVAGFVRHAALMETVQFALILTIASIPVALPAVLSVTMAIGAERLARLKAIVARLVSIEELAGVDVLCSDKTGTLTQNRLTLGEPQPAAGVTREDLLQAARLASRVDAPDAIDAAILAAGSERPLTDARVTAFHPFDPIAKMARAEVLQDGRAYQVAKGAPQVILDLCGLAGAMRDAPEKGIDAQGARGLRTLGVASQDTGAGWRYLGLLTLYDPPREDGRATIARAHAMGVQIKMVTGDHEAIAREISGQLGLGRNIAVASRVFDDRGQRAPAQLVAQIEAADGFARVLPEHKFEIVKALQDSGHIVGMTGDGVNDAPALKQADVGIAVSGATDAARAAADLVLTAPGLSVITTAIEEARQIFARMTSYATYRIAETIRLVLFMTACILAFDYYPVTAVMVVLLALLNDLSIMMIAYDHTQRIERPARWDMRRVLTTGTMLGVYGVIESFVLFWWLRNYLQLPQPQVQALVFLKLLVSGHMTIYLTRNQGWFWQRPWPSWKLVLPSEATQLAGTLVVVYGLFMAPTGWGYALAVWLYALLSFLLANVLKVVTLRLLDLRTAEQQRHLQRIRAHAA